MIRWICQQRIRTILAVVAVFLVGSACSTSSKQRNTSPMNDGGAIQASTVEGQQRFDEAVAMLNNRQFEEAQEAFRLLQAEHGTDEISAVAEVYLARAMMGHISDTSQPSDEAAFLLSSLMDDRSVDDRIRFAAQLYYALELSIRGQREDALTILHGYPGPSLSPIVLTNDHAVIWPLIAEGFYRAGRGEDALHALNRLMESIPDQSPANVSDGNAIATIKTYAMARGFDIATNLLQPVELQSFLATESPFLRAIAGTELISRNINTKDDEHYRALQQLFLDVSADLNRIGAEERVAELSLLMSTMGGPKRIAIGALIPMSGRHRPVGQRVMAGLLVAQKTFHSTEQPITTIIFQDSNGDLNTAFEVFKEQGVASIIGPIDTTKAREAATLATLYEVPMISMAPESLATMDDVDDVDDEGTDRENRFVFRNFVNAADEARVAASVSFDVLEDRKVALVFPDIGYGRMMSEAFAETFREHGGQIVATIAYDRTSTNYQPVAEAVAASLPDAIFIPDTAGKVAEISAFMAQQNVWGLSPMKRPPKEQQRIFVHYLGTSLWLDGVLLRQASSYVDGAVFPAWFSSVFENDVSNSFVQRFQAIYDRTPQNYEAFAYDTLSILRHLILEKKAVGRDQLQEAIIETPSYNGVTGTFRFENSGESVRDLRLLNVDKNQLIHFIVD